MTMPENRFFYLNKWKSGSTYVVSSEPKTSQAPRVLPDLTDRSSLNSKSHSFPVNFMVIGTDQTTSYMGEFADVLVVYEKEKGRISVIGMIRAEIVWSRSIHLRLSEWKHLFRGEFDQMVGWKAWFLRE